MKKKRKKKQSAARIITADKLLRDMWERLTLANAEIVDSITLLEDVYRLLHPQTPQKAKR